MRPRALLATVLLALAAASAPADAATITVDRTIDAAPAAGQCTSPSMPDCSLRQAIDEAASGDTVAIPPNSASYAVDGFGELAVNKPITLAGGGARTTIIDARAAPQRVIHITGSGTVTIRGVTITGADLPGGFAGSGGGIFVEGPPAPAPGPTLRLADSAVSGNRSDGGGAGIRASLGGLHISNSAVIGNNADTSANGGALAIENSPEASLVNTTVAGNSAQNIGGALFADTTTVTIVNSTLAGNSANSSAGAIYPTGGATVSLRNSIVADNTSGIPGQDNCVAPGFGQTSAGHNIEDQNTCGFNGTGDKPSTDPRLTPVQNNGGPTNTRALLNGSPATNAGTNSGCPATDQRGALRPAGTACDIGAYEVAVPRASTGPASGVSTTAAKVSGVVFNPDIAAGSAVFDYGTTAAFGQSTPAQRIAAASRRAAVGATLANLQPNTRYFFRLRTSNPSGFASGAGGTFVTPPAISALSSLRISPSAFRAARRGGPVGPIPRRRRAPGATVRYRASQPATVTFTVQRRTTGRRQSGRCRKVTRRNRSRRRCVRWVRVRGSFTRTVAGGSDAFVLTGRMGGKKLKPRRYRLRAVSRNTTGTGRAVTRRFRIRRTS